VGQALSLRDLAEDAFAWIDSPEVEWRRDDELVLRHVANPHPFYGMVLRPRVRDVDAALESARAWFRERERQAYMWFVSDASTPGDLADQLLARGLVHEELDPVYSGMVLQREPVAVAGVEVRKVERYEDALAAAELAWRSFKFTPEQIEASRATHRERWEHHRDPTRGGSFIALVDGEVVGAGGVAYLPGAVYLLGGNVAEEARGRGVYRALVRARWDDAVARGTPALVVQAGQMSGPILDRLGFETLCRIQALVDVLE
jgi:hypothetical protein